MGWAVVLIVFGSLFFFVPQPFVGDIGPFMGTFFIAIGILKIYLRFRSIREAVRGKRIQ